MATRDAELFKDKIEISLDGRQIFYLFFGGAIIACLVFVLGVMVGRKVEARGHVAHATSNHGDPLAALDALAANDELAFPSALRGDADSPLGPVDVALAGGAAPVPAVAVAAPASDEDRDQAAAAAIADDNPAATPAADPADQPADAKAAKGDKPAADPTGKAAKGDKPADGKAAKPGKPAADPAPGKGKFTLQLSSFQDRSEAEAFFAEIAKAGYTPYLIEAAVDGKGTFYRVRVGSYRSYDEALAAKQDFEARQKVIAYVTRVAGD